MDKAGTGFPLENRCQLDCVDESLNTTACLAMMKQDGLLRFHDLRDPASEGVPFQGLTPYHGGYIRTRQRQRLCRGFLVL